MSTTALVPDVRRRMEMLRARKQLLADEYLTTRAQMHRLVDHHNWSSRWWNFENKLITCGRRLERLANEIDGILDEMWDLEQQRRIYQP